MPQDTMRRPGHPGVVLGATTDVNSLRAAGAMRAAGPVSQRAAVPNDAARELAFPGQLRAQRISQDGREFFQTTGYASIVERSYQMWDWAGEYKEIISSAAFDKTLAAKPDVAFLANHKGVTMARTTNGSLQLSVDTTGLHSVALLNPDRQDVRDLVTAIEDQNITEMSFAFMVVDGQWSPDYTEYRINEVDLHRGDVSAVNYGANPYTSIAARSQQIIANSEFLPTGAARALLERLQNRADLANDAQPAPVPSSSAPTGRGLSIVQALLDLG